MPLTLHLVLSVISFLFLYLLISGGICIPFPDMPTLEPGLQDIRSGNIAYLMNRPYYYPFYILARYTGEWNVRLPMYVTLAVGVGVAAAGRLPGFGLFALLVSAVSILLGITINGVFKVCISLIAFWVEDANPFHWLYDKMILIVGILFPIEVFPRAVWPLLKFTPIYTVCYGPAKLAVDFHADAYPEILLAQLLYLAAGCGLMFFIYGKGVRKLYVNGG